MTTTTSDQVIQSINPATGEIFASLEMSPLEDVPRIISRARQAQPGWAAMDATERAAIIAKAGPRLVEESERIGRMLTEEMGKPLNEAIGEVKHSGESLDAQLEEIVEALKPRELRDENTITTMQMDPYGVCVSITPWNFPILMPHSTVIPALVAGNTVILKPSEETTAVAIEYVSILNEFLPENVLQVVVGDERHGKALVKGDVNLIAFTGSREAGQHILATAGADLKRVILELGGKDPMIVLHDADIDAAADFAVNNSFRNAGQVCVSTERIYVDKRIESEFEAAMIERTNKLIQGNGLDPDTRIGPMINSNQKQKVLAQLEKAGQEGARVVMGGGAGEGNFVPLTILSDLNHDMEIMREETFGPIACVMSFEDEDNAVDLANDTPFGLGAAIFSKDVQRASRLASGMTAGMVGINKGCGGAKGSPWVGAQQSGYGFHSGPEGHRQFAQLRTISVPVS